MNSSKSQMECVSLNNPSHLHKKEQCMNRRIFIASVILAAVSFLVMAPTVMAQQRGTPLTPEERVANLEKAITLTPAQKTQLIKIYTDLAAAAGGGGGRGGGGGFGGVGTLPAAVVKVLNPDQVKKYTAYARQLSIDTTINRIDQAVTLTDDQKKKIVPIIAKQVDAQAAMMAERAKQVAAGETPDPQAMMDKMTELRNATTEALKSILKPDQLEKYNAMPRGGRGGGGGTRGQ